MKIIISFIHKTISAALFTLIIFTCGCNDNSLNLHYTPVTINGKVVDDYGNGIGNVTVSFGNVGNQNIKSSVDGSFSIELPGLPYDAIVLKDKSICVYKGLTTLNPLLGRSGISNFSKGATVFAFVPLINSNQFMTVWFTDTSGLVNSWASTNYGQNVDFGVQWSGDNVLHGKIAVLVWTFQNGNTISYDNFGEKPAILTNGQTTNLTFTAADIATNPGEVSVSGNIAGNNTASSFSSIMCLSSGTNININSPGYRILSGSSSSFDFLLPDLGQEYRYYVLASDWNNDLETSSKIVQVFPGLNSIVLGRFPVLLSPPNGSQNVNYNTEFSFTVDNSSGVNFTSIQFYDSGYGSVSVISKINSFRLPDLRYLGFNFHTNIEYNWYTINYPDLHSVDDFVTKPYYYNPGIKSTIKSKYFSFRTSIDSSGSDIRTDFYRN